MTAEELIRLADLFSDAALLVGPDGEVLAGSRAVKSLGYAPKALAGRRLFELVSTPEGSVREYLRLCFRSREPMIGSLDFLAPGGRVVSCRCYGAVVHHDPEMRASRVLLRLTPKESSPSEFAVLKQKIDELTQEIHRRRQAEERLRDQSEWFEVTLSSIGDAVITTDAEGRVTFLNPVAEGLTGWKRGDARGYLLEEVFRIINEHTRQTVDNPARRVLAEGRIVGLANHTVLIARDGREIPIDDSGAPIRADDGRIAGVVLVFRDVTERKRAEDALRESELRFRQMAAHITDVFWMSEPASSKILYVSPAYESIWGRSCESLYEAPSSFLEAVHPEDRGRVVAMLDKQARGASTAEEYRIVRPDGVVRWVWDRRFPVRGEVGSVHRVAGIAEDITERKLADEELRESEARLRRIVESNVVGLLVANFRGRIREANDAFLQMVGYSREDLRSGRLDFQGLTPPEYQHLDRGAMAEMSATGRHTPFEKEYLRKDGGRIPVLVGMAYLGRDKEGAEIGVGFIVDMTEQKKVERALRDSEEKFRHMADAIPQLAWMARPDGHIFWYNRRWYDYTGTTPEAMEGWGWQSVHHPDAVSKVEAQWKVSLEREEPFDMVFPLRGADGAFRPFLTRVNALRGEDGRVLYWFGTNTDISEQKRAEDAFRFLADASAALAAVVDDKSTLDKLASLSVPRFGDWCVVDVVDPDGSLRRVAATHVDPAKVAAVHELGRRSPPKLDVPFDAAARVAHTGAPEHHEDLPDSLLEERVRDPEPLRLLRALGLRSYLCVPMKARGKVLGVLTFVAAGPGRRYGETDLALAEELARRAAVALENARLYAELRDADRRKDEFLATLAHELRNPLAPIWNTLQILKLPGADPSIIAQSRDRMERQVQHLVRLVDDLLDVSRVMRGKIDLRKQRVSLSQVTTHAIETAQPQITSKGHTLHVSLPPHPLDVEADPVRLAQVVSNLLTNAARYTEKKGHIWLTAAREAGRVVVRVRDDGIGIAPEMLPRIFDLFTQVDNSVARSHGGLGIGLTLVKSLVEMHGGEVEARSAGLGQGSEFTVKLPPAAAEEAATPEHAGERGEPERTSAPAKWRVLVVDDNTDAADTLAMLLELSGSDVQVANDGLSALAAAASRRPDIIFLDIGMPHMDGYEVARRIRKTPSLDGVLLVALTGWGQEEDRRRSAEAGFDVHLVKPVEPGALETVLTHPRLSPRSEGGPSGGA